ncbi:MAG TPA: group III truncated hemoglobin [Bacteroidia bacterium]|nr:group III truncated hemoglobin [Bacteroidia bacterium]QQR96593.1 MAG: group III truncated hemoglobin [Bacteroidota bacterium]MBP7713816.1 group III truncated hemoglobin [Bacteroidia bacterium]MBP8668396.1 group III truncated hemoglobin [Bacteroidia bacterium]HOZ82919.1 group III truncated hemoglobin [Bacteroidia bacterium]
MRDIENINDIQLLVDSFYGKIRDDEKLGHIFNGIIKDRWPEHLEKMYRFWQTILLEDQTYFGSPFVPHAKMPVDKTHFEQWIKLFSETVDENFVGEKAEQAKWQGQRMAEMFHYKIEYIKNSSTTPLQ